MFKFLFLSLFCVFIYAPLICAQEVLISDFLVNDSKQNSEGVGQTQISVTPNGNFAVAWMDFNLYDTFEDTPMIGVQLFSPIASPIGAFNLFHTETDNTDSLNFFWSNDGLAWPNIKFQPNGALLIGVEHNGFKAFSQDGISSRSEASEVGLAAVSATGQIIDMNRGSGVVSILDAEGLELESRPRISSNTSGDFFLTWHGQDTITGLFNVTIQKFDSNGNFAGSPFSPHINNQDSNADPDIVTNGDLLAVVWGSTHQDPNWDVMMQFYKNGEPFGGSIMVNDDTGNSRNIVASIEMNSSGDSVVVWIDYRSHPDGLIFGQRFNSSGQPVGQNFQISDVIVGSGEDGATAITSRPSVAVLNNGFFMVTWTIDIVPDQFLTDFESEFALGRIFDSGANAITETFFISNVDGQSSDPDVATDGNDFYCAWYDWRLNPEVALEGAEDVPANVFAKKIEGPGPKVFPAPVAHFSANITEGNAPLSVQFSDNSTGNPDTWFWEFGDSETSTNQNPAHLYADQGFYNVTLRVSNQNGEDSETKFDFISVQARNMDSCPHDGDVNQDGTITVDDVVLAFDSIFDDSIIDDCQMDHADINNDGTLTVDDVLCIFDTLIGNACN